MTAEPQHQTNSPPRREREPEKPRANGAGHKGFRSQPHNVEAEQALLGAILINNDAWHEVAGFLRPEHFYEPVHGRLFGALDRTIRAGHLADYILLNREFNDDDVLKEIDGAQYLARLARAAETIINAGEYGRLVHDLAVKRGLIHVGEELVNKAYDASIVEPAGTQIGKARELFQHLSRELSPITSLPEVDLDVVAEGQFSAHEWAIDQIVPVGTAGLIGGPQSAGKTFLELIRMICMVTGRNFLGHKVRQIHAALGYFSEDSKGWLERYIGKICRALQIDPRDLKGRFRAISTFGAHRVLFRADRDATEVTPTAWFDEVRDEALSMRAGWVAFDHLLRYCAYPHISTPLNFSLFEQLDALSTEISGNVVVLTHPSKTDMRAGVKGLIQIGGAASLVQAPRWVQTLRRLDDEGGRKIRQFTVEKVSYGERQRFAIRLSENDGIVVHDGEMDPDDDGSGKNPSRQGARGPASNAGRTLMVLEEMFAEGRREIPLDELVAECIRRGVINEAQENSNAWRDRRKLVRRHMSEKRALVDIRTSDLGECYALKPQL